MYIFRTILLIIALALLIVSVKQFMNGYDDWQQAQIDERGYQQEIDELKAKRDHLKQRVELLKTDILTQERLVRKRLGYAKPGEVKFKIVKPTQSD